MRRGPRITYHGRTGRPKVHTSSTGRDFIMVRRRGGGTKRLYGGSTYGEGPHGTGRRRRLRL